MTTHPPEITVDLKDVQMCAAESIVSLAYRELPRDVIAIAKNCVLDTLAVAVAGSTEESVTLLREVIVHAPGPASLWGTTHAADPVAAATVNGAAAHALDYDDLSKSAMCGHPSAPLLPALLAAAQVGRVSGASLIESFVAGYELEARLGLALGTGHYERGFHSTATLGAFGAAAGAAKLMGLTTRETARALSIAAAQSSGLKLMFGSMVKPMQVGRAAGAGLLAALLAKSGYSAPESVLTGNGSYAMVYADALDPSPLTQPFSSEWLIRQNLVKEHASCYGTHATIDGLSTLRERLQPTEQIEEIELRVPPGHLSVCAIPDPKTGLEGKFSLAYTAALALLRDDAGPGRFTDEAASAPDLRLLATRVRVVPDASVSELGTVIRVRTSSGEPVSAEVDSIASGTSRPPDEQWNRIVRKTEHLVTDRLGSELTEQLIETVATLEDSTDASALVQCVTPTTPIELVQQ